MRYVLQSTSLLRFPSPCIIATKEGKNRRILCYVARMQEGYHVTFTTRHSSIYPLGGVISDKNALGKHLRLAVKTLNRAIREGLLVDVDCPPVLSRQTRAGRRGS